jgi:hypothetical protein
MMVLRNSGQPHAKNVVLRRNLPKAPDKGHDGISARYRQLGVDRRRVKITGKLTLVLLNCDQLANCCLEHADVPAYSVSSSPTLIATMTSPVEQSTECPSHQCHWQVTRKAKEYHA